MPDLTPLEAAEWERKTRTSCGECERLWNNVLAWCEHWKSEHVRKQKSKTFAFTLTTGSDDPAMEEEMREAARKLFRQKYCEIQEGECFLEFTGEGRPHIHGWYQTVDGGRVFAKVFKRCWKTWGEKKGHTKFAGGYHEEMKTNRYLGYAAAEGRCVVMKKNGILNIDGTDIQDHPQDDSPSVQHEGEGQGSEADEACEESG